MMTRDEFMQVAATITYKDQVEVSWVTDGMHGGSWREDDVPRPITPDAEPADWESLDLLLEQVVPAITLLQYKRLVKLAQSTSETVREWYGNWDTTETKFIKLSDLWDFLESHNLVGAA